MFDAFEIFSLTPSYEIDVEKLTQAYFNLQNQSHPDRFINASIQERELAEKKGANINKAYQLLKNPISRAEILLSSFKKDPSFESLSEQMALREELETLKDPIEQEAFQKKIEALFLVKEKALEICFREKKLEEAAAVLIDLKYLYKLREKTRHLEEAQRADVKVPLQSDKKRDPDGACAPQDDE
jgi:molecular chaperone HscB